LRNYPHALRIVFKICTINHHHLDVNKSPKSQFHTFLIRVPQEE
jgi:hypothetical protein